ncbi:hypothetical protein J7S33_19830 [Saccharothrix algeriensis]|uniref:Uncharacterized protein n=1 Tax=Saccharothrix algeriensis TaxID=173560 RepID=A0A8T8HT63_9PSEU|nr:hypothetical protein J7S33_19830 [Saccharothrix algeriensis]
MTLAPIRSAQGVVGVVYGLFFLESRGLRGPPRFTFTRDDDFLVVMDDVLALVTSSDLVARAEVRIEAWSAPPAGAPDGAERSERRVRLTDAALHARAVPATTPDIAAVELGPPGWYHARAFRWGAGHEQRVEHFLVQLWPSDEPGDADRARPAAPDEFADWNLEVRSWAENFRPG